MGQILRRGSVIVCSPGCSGAKLGRMLEPRDTQITPQEMRIEYRQLLEGTHDAAATENVVFFVFSTSLDDGRGDLFVALGLARALKNMGWGVAFRGVEKWGDPLPPHTSVTVAMLQDAVPVQGTEDIVRVAWARNWIDDWANRAPLWAFDVVFASSNMAVEALRPKHFAPTEVLPIGVDPDLFHADGRRRNLGVSTTVNLWGDDRKLVQDLKHSELSSPIHWFGNGVHEIGAHVPQLIVEVAVDYVDVAAIYSRSILVLDDLTSSARKYGCQNSRLYEALAAGSLVITNCAEGLHELGLGAVPVVGRDGTLRQIIDFWLSHEDERTALVSSLRTQVLVDHTFARRAEVFANLVLRGREHIPARQEVEKLRREIAGLELERGTLRAALLDAEVEIERFRKRLTVRVADRVRRTILRQ